MSEKDDPNIDNKPDDADTDPVDDDKGDGHDQLGDAGKKAIDAMKAKWQKERDERKALAAENAALKATAGAKDDSEKDEPTTDQIREQARKEARAESLRERALDKVEAKAAKLFADPEDARALLASKVDKFIDGDELDLEAITEALEDLLKKKPHLAATGGQRFNGSADGGARKGSGKPAQLTEQDLKRMNPRQIVEAQAKGQLDDLLGVT